MKYLITVTLILILHQIQAQEFFDYEKEIPNIKNYSNQEINFKNELENITLSGTLLEPQNTYFNKLVIIVPGSGLDTRHSHYLLTENLLKNNIAVFRYDERGVNKSEGNNSNVNYGVTQITNDLMAAIQVLESKYNNSDVKIGLIGHSQGGMAAINTIQGNANIDFLVQWAVPVQKHGEFLKYQIQTGANTFDRELIFDSNKEKFEIIYIVQDVISKNPEMDDIKLSKTLKKATRKHGYKRENYDRFTFWTFPSRKDLLRQNNEKTYENLDVPMLYIIGSKDIFVDPKANIDFLNSLNNNIIETLQLENLNHYLTSEDIDPGNLKMSSSYYEIDQKALNQITSWIIAQ
ncbi:alpha/beta hydrolase [Salegentibacter sp. HM20]